MLVHALVTDATILEVRAEDRLRRKLLELHLGVRIRYVRQEYTDVIAENAQHVTAAIRMLMDTI